jgi:hypothetical protein
MEGIEGPYRSIKMRLFNYTECLCGVIKRFALGH